MALLLTGKLIAEFGIRNSATDFFNVWAKQLHNLHNIAERMHDGKVHEGDWHDIGSVKIWTYTIDGKVETCKESIEAIDEENKLIIFNLFDGEISKNYKVLKPYLQVIDHKEQVGAVVKWTLEFEKLDEDVALPYHYLEFGTAMTKDIDAHLLKGNK
ncbi:START-like domain superfamily [Sesbania bispinosa]|nr:START-like domain superfamily [Sesbania bispinosa]